MRLFALWAVGFGALCGGCGGGSVRLEGRPCSTDSDCVLGNVCVGAVCVDPSLRNGGDIDPDDDDAVIAQLTFGPTFSVGVSSALEDVPVLLVLDAARLEPALLRADGGNLRFVDVAAQAIVLHDIAHFDVDGTSYVWLQLPQLGKSRLLQVGYGPSDLTAPADNGWARSKFSGVWHFETSSPVTDASAVVGSFAGPTHIGDGLLGDALAPAAGQTLRVVRSQTASDDLVIELVVAAAPDSWSQKRTLTIAPATAVAELQVNWDVSTLEGRRVLNGNGENIATWTEPFDATSGTLWARVPEQGTSTLTVYEAPGAAYAEAGYDVVLEPGLAYSRWTVSNTTTYYGNYDAMNTYFAAQQFASATTMGTATVIDCPATCVSSQVDYFALLFEGWLLSPGGNYYFGSGSDDHSDVLLGGRQWKSGGGAVKVVDNYGTHGVPDTPVISGPVALANGPTRFQYRFMQIGGYQGYRVAMSPTSQTPTFADIIPAEAFRSRKRLLVQPTVSASAATWLGTLLREAGDIDVAVTPKGVRARAGAAALEGGGLKEWHAVTIAIADGMATLYVDGIAVSSKAATIAAGNRELVIGDILNDPISRSVLVDELRVSQVPRSAEWIAAQAENLRGELVTWVD